MTTPMTAAKGLLCLAVNYYERALAAAPTADGAVDLRLEAAYNLAAIYRTTGATELARAVLRRYLTL